jgi:hypothetical protein
MKYEIRQEFNETAEQVINAMMHPEVAAFLMKHMKSLKEMELLERTETDDTIVRRVRYRIVPVIEKIGPKKIPPEAFEWVEQSTFDKKKRIMVYKNVPTKHKIAKLFENFGEIRITDAGARCVRMMSGELKIHFPLLGSVAEKMIYKKAAEILDEEAAALRLFMSPGNFPAGSAR